MTMLIKAGVDISRLKPPIRKKLSKVDTIFRVMGEFMIVSSTYEGDHSAGSLHYAHKAIDIRYPLKLNDMFKRDLEACFGADYDVVWEQSHIHVEYDPK